MQMTMSRTLDNPRL